MLHARSAPRHRRTPVVGVLCSRYFRQGERQEARPACCPGGRSGVAGELAGSPGIVGHARRLCALANTDAASREIVRSRQPQPWRETGLPALRRPRTVGFARSRADGGRHVAAAVGSLEAPVLCDGRRFRRPQARLAGEIRRLRPQRARKHRPPDATPAQGHHGGSAAPGDLVAEALRRGAWRECASSRLQARLCKSISVSQFRISRDRAVADAAIRPRTASLRPTS